MRLLFFLLLIPCLAFSQRARDTTYTVQVRDSFGLKFQVVRETREELIDSSEFVRQAFVKANAEMLPVREAARVWLNAANNRKNFDAANEQLRSASGRNYFQLSRQFISDTLLTGLWLIRQTNQSQAQARALEYRNGRFRECVVRIRERIGVYKILSYVATGINDVPRIYNLDHFILQVASGSANALDFYYQSDEPSINPALNRKIYSDLSLANGRPRWVLVKRTEVDEDSEQGKAIVSTARTATATNRKP